MIKYSCTKCTHSDVCRFKDDAIQAAKSFDKTVNTSILEHDLRCKHYCDSATIKCWGE